MSSVSKVSSQVTQQWFCGGQRDSTVGTCRLSRISNHACTSYCFLRWMDFCGDFLCDDHCNWVYLTESGRSGLRNVIPPILFSFSQAGRSYSQRLSVLYIGFRDHRVTYCTHKKSKMLLEPENSYMKVRSMNQNSK